MPIIYNQAIACRFGLELADLLETDTWTHLDIAVAWVRRSGIRHILPGLIRFLQRGGLARIAVGIDIENTSKEGLEDLLSLTGYGAIQTFVHHNEHPRVTFHPKVYLFRNDKKACLIVGSNNLTESGLFTNTEAGLQVDAAISESVIVTIRSAIDSWCDPSERLAHLLDDVFLAALVQGGYIRTEEALNRERARSRRNAGGSATPARPPLFGSKAQSVPAPPSGLAAPTSGTSPSAGAARRARPLTSAPTSGTGTVLLIRPRLARGTQMQIPIPLKEGAFLNAVNEVVSDHDGAIRPISEAKAQRGGGTVNTYKLELPEGHGIVEPVMRLWTTDDGTVRYHVYTAGSSDGLVIMQRLEEGRHTTPPLTTVTKRNDPDHSTWYRFV